MAEIAEQYGRSEARVAELERVLEGETVRYGAIEGQYNALQEEFERVRDLSMQLSQECAALKVQFGEMKVQRDDERSQRGKLEEEVRMLHGRLVEKERRAATAEEKARQRRRHGSWRCGWRG